MDNADLSEKIKDIATKLRSNRAQQQREAAESQVFRMMIDPKFAIVLQRTKLHTEERSHAYDSAQEEMLNARVAPHLAQWL